MGPAPHTLSFSCPDLSRLLLPNSHSPSQSFQVTKAGMGTFSEYSWETPLGIFIHLVEKLAVFIRAQDGEGHETKKMAFLPSHSKEKYNLGLRARQASEGEKSSIKTAGGSISKTEQKIGFPHPPVALRARHTAQNKARGPGLSDASFLRSPCMASLVLGFLRASLLPLSPSLQHRFPQHKGDSKGSRT